MDGKGGITPKKTQTGRENAYISELLKQTMCQLKTIQDKVEKIQDGQVSSSQDTQACKVSSSSQAFLPDSGYTSPNERC